MKAKQFYRLWSSKVKAPTNGKIKNLARKVGLKDTYSEIFAYTGLDTTEAREFTIPEPGENYKAYKLERHLEGEG